MAEGVREEWWNHTSHLMAALHNSNPYRKDDAKPSDFNPTLRRGRKEPDVMVPLSQLSGLIVKENRKPGTLIGGGTQPVLPPTK